MKKELTTSIKNYIKNHKEMQVTSINVTDMEKCAAACKCRLLQVMQVLRYGRVF